MDALNIMIKLNIIIAFAVGIAAGNKPGFMRAIAIGVAAGALILHFNILVHFEVSRIITAIK